MPLAGLEPARPKALISETSVSTKLPPQRQDETGDTAEGRRIELLRPFEVLACFRDRCRRQPSACPSEKEPARLAYARRKRSRDGPELEREDRDENDL